MFYTLDAMQVTSSDLKGDTTGIIPEELHEYLGFFDPDRVWDKESFEKNPNISDRDIYRGSARRPAYILRGKKVTPEQAFDIIATESAPGDYFGDMYQDTAKPERVPVSSNHNIRLYREQGYNWIRSWIDPEGNVGESCFTYKYPCPYELLCDNIEYAARYPYLEYVIIYSELNEIDWDVWNHHGGCIAPFCETTIEQIMENFEYAVWVHDGGAEVVDKEKAFKLYHGYNALYEDEKIFSRDDWDSYVHHFLDEEYLTRLDQVWHLKPEKLADLMQLLKERPSVEEEWLRYKKVFCSREGNQAIADLRAKVINAIEDAVRRGTISDLDLTPYWKKFMEIPMEEL